MEALYNKKLFKKLRQKQILKMKKAQKRLKIHKKMRKTFNQ